MARFGDASTSDAPGFDAADREQFDGSSFDDEELAAIALAAGDDPAIFAAVFDDDAVPFGDPDDNPGSLPAWYMPVPAGLASTHRRGRAVVVGALIASLLTVNGFGLCVTYGLPEVGDRIFSF